MYVTITFSTASGDRVVVVPRAAVQTMAGYQVVFVAAGMDTRAFRLPWPSGCMVYEVDHETLITEKHKRLVALSARAACDRREVCADLATFAPLTTELAPLFAALASGKEPHPAEEDLAERLADEAAQRPAIPRDQLRDLLGEIRLRVEGERVKRELLHYGPVLPEMDPETAREMDPRVLAAMTLKEQLTVRLQKEQAQHRRQPPASADDADSAPS